MDVAPMNPPLLSLIVQFLLGAAVGVAAGFLYFAALRWNVGFIERGAAPRAALLALARFAALAAVLAGLAKLGALALLAGAAGLLVARGRVLRRLGPLQ
jgi:F1F0 ATPase subunit 2